MANLDNFRIEEAYKLKVLGENSVAPHRPCPKCNKVDCPCANAENNEENCECGSTPGGHADAQDSNIDMAKRSLFRIFKLSAMLHDILAKSEQDIEPWVAAKINDAHENIESVFGYEDYNAARKAIDVSELEENNEHELYSAIDKGGSDLLSTLKSVLKKESKETLEKILLETIKVLETK